jgi:hypothetical protein
MSIEESFHIPFGNGSAGEADIAELSCNPLISEYILV